MLIQSERWHQLIGMALRSQTAPYNHTMNTTPLDWFNLWNESHRFIAFPSSRRSWDSIRYFNVRRRSRKKSTRKEETTALEISHISWVFLGDFYLLRLRTMEPRPSGYTPHWSRRCFVNFSRVLPELNKYLSLFFANFALLFFLRRIYMWLTLVETYQNLLEVLSRSSALGFIDFHYISSLKLPSTSDRPTWYD